MTPRFLDEGEIIGFLQNNVSSSCKYERNVKRNGMSDKDRNMAKVYGMSDAEYMAFLKGVRAAHLQMFSDFVEHFCKIKPEEVKETNKLGSADTPPSRANA